MQQHQQRNPRLNQQPEPRTVGLCEVKHWLGIYKKAILNMTYSDMTSGGKLRGISPALSHNALSLVHVHDEGQRGCLALLLSTKSKTDATTIKPSQGDLLGILRVFPILAGTTCASNSPAHEPGSPLWFRLHCCCLEAKRRAVRACLSPPSAVRRRRRRSGGDENRALRTSAALRSHDTRGHEKPIPPPATK